MMNKKISKKNLILISSISVLAVVILVVGCIHLFDSASSNEKTEDADSSVVTDYSEYARLEKLDKLIEFHKIEPTDSEEDRIMKENMNYNANLAAIQRAFRVYYFLSVNYGDMYWRTSVITDDEVDIQYMELMIKALEEGMVNENFVTFENVRDLINYVYCKQDLLDADMLQRFAVAGDFYKAKYVV